MAFNFNWSPLIADTMRAKEMLTTALNKGPKPPIIVGDIVVKELNLGDTPPELEILEIGDLAEDRFRGIFKMSYSGDAFLTLKTRVQANPLNTALSTKPSFASPQPLAAASGLTIPVSITLSEIRLSGFVILVFSRQKGLTLVFRNDPLESLKVSSTFDSIPFIANYLQKEIEKQLRNLFMEDLPVILHKLSLQLFSPEHQAADNTSKDKQSEDEAAPVDPLSSPPQDPVDILGNPLDDGPISWLSLDHSSEGHSSFSQKNLLRLAALQESHRTLSLFTPSMRDTVFRAWAGAHERGDHSGTQTPTLTHSSLSRIQSSTASTASSTFSVSDGGSEGSISSRPTLSSFSSTYSGLSSTGASRSRAHGGRQRKKRVISLRRTQSYTDTASIAPTEDTTPDHSVVGGSSSGTVPSIPEEPEEELRTPPRSPNKSVHFTNPSAVDGTTDSVEVTPRPKTRKARREPEPEPAPMDSQATIKPAKSKPVRPSMPNMTSLPLLRTYSMDKLSSLPTTPHHQHNNSGYASSESSGGILEQAWIQKMASEIARKVADEKAARRQSSGMSKGKMAEAFWAGEQGEGESQSGMDGLRSSPPPAYAA